MVDVGRPLSYAAEAGRRRRAMPALALAGATAALVLLGLATAAARQPGPWRGPLGGRESATIVLTSGSLGLAALATAVMVLGWAKGRRGALEVAARIAVILYWILFLLVAGVGGALK